MRYTSDWHVQGSCRAIEELGDAIAIGPLAYPLRYGDKEHVRMVRRAGTWPDPDVKALEPLLEAATRDPTISCARRPPTRPSRPASPP